MIKFNLPRHLYDDEKLLFIKTILQRDLSGFELDEEYGFINLRANRPEDLFNLPVVVRGVLRYFTRELREEKYPPRILGIYADFQLEQTGNDTTQEFFTP